jgi:hypothetical protein
VAELFEQVFFQVIDDLDAGEAKPLHRYLDLVPAAERDELADLLAAVLAARGPAAAPTSAESESYARALAVIKQASQATGASGTLPDLLVRIRHSRGIERDAVIDALAERFEVGAPGRSAFRRLYHQLEAGQLLGTRVSRRLLTALGETFQIDERDLDAASKPTGGSGPAAPTLTLARGSSETRSRARSEACTEGAAVDAEEELVRRLFTGGRDA